MQTLQLLDLKTSSTALSGSSGSTQKYHPGVVFCVRGIVGVLSYVYHGSLPISLLVVVNVRPPPKQALGAMHCPLGSCYMWDVL